MIPPSGALIQDCHYVRSLESHHIRDDHKNSLIIHPIRLKEGFCMNPEVEKIKISTDADCQHLVNQFHNGPPFASAFEFSSDKLWEEFASSIGLNLDTFNSNQYYFDPKSKVHISRSMHGYTWISTIGLVAKSRVTDNKYVNAYSCQKIILDHLLNDAILLANDNSTYDIDSYNYSMVEELTLALFHSTLFYYETFAKAYLSLSGEIVPRTHSLNVLLKCVKKAMLKSHQDNTLFHAYVIPMFEKVVQHIALLPKNFKEQYVKYDDNNQDTTLVLFDLNELKNMRDIVEIACDIIYLMYFDCEGCFYFKKNLYQRLLAKCKTPKDIEQLAKKYGFLLDEL